MHRQARSIEVVSWVCRLNQATGAFVTSATRSRSFASMYVRRWSRRSPADMCVFTTHCE